MNCKKIFAAVVAFAMLSVSVTGYAAIVNVNTTTTYNGANNKVEVETTVSGATDDSEVTYIVKSGGEIVYIDQNTAADGKVSFTYRITRSKIASDYSTTVKFGSSAESETFTGDGSADLGIESLQQATDDSHYTISYAGGEQAWGYGETVSATVVPDTGYEVTAIYIDGVEQTASATKTVELTYGQVLSAEVEAIEVTPGVKHEFVEGSEEITVDGVTGTYVTKTAILTPSGTVDSVGVIYDGVYYPSYGAVSSTSAVKIIFPKDATDTTLSPAYEIDGVVTPVSTNQ